MTKVYVLAKTAMCFQRVCWRNMRSERGSITSLGCIVLNSVVASVTSNIHSATKRIHLLRFLENML